MPPRELLETIRSLKHDGVAVLLSSHLLERVQSVCDRVALFNAGRIALLGTVPELARQVLGGGYNLEVEADGEGLALQFSEIPGVKAVDQAGPAATGCWRTATFARRPPPPWSTPAARAGCRSRSRASTRSTTAISRTPACEGHPTC